MSRIQKLPSLRSAPSTHVAVGTFVLLWVVQGIVIGGVRVGYFPAPLLAVFDFVFIDILAMTGFKLWMAIHPESFMPNRLSFAITSSIGFALLSLVAAAWYRVFSDVMAENA